MTTRRILSGLFAIALTPLIGSCSDDDVPVQVTSDFDFLTDAFSFPNFADNAEGPALTSDQAARMFGPDAVCEGGRLPCTPFPQTTAWVANINQTLAEGRSEGFATLALLFHLGRLDPNDFGAANASELVLNRNIVLQSEIAYWAATQSVAGAVENRRFTAANVMPFLADVLRPGQTEAYRLAIAVRTETGFESGHALVPIGYYLTDDQGVYMLRVYDSNFPSSERLLEIDTAAGSWRYEVEIADDNTLVYEGTAANQNYLYFAPVTPRLEQLPVPFGDGSGQANVTSAGPIQAVASIEGTATVGIRDGEVVEDGGTLTPAFANCPLCGKSKGILTYNMPVDSSGQSSPVDITVSAGLGMTMNTDNSASISVVHPKHTTTVSGITGDSSMQNRLQVGSDGGVTYTNTSRTGVTITSQRTAADGTTQSVTVTISGASDTVTISSDANGNPVITTDGVPEGTTVTLQLGDGDNAQSVTVTASGDDQTFAIDPSAGSLMDGVSTTPSHCLNGIRDQDTETDVDCGNECDACTAVGQFCGEDTDCGGDLTCGRFRRCVMVGTCVDEAMNGDETDVDCGGGTCGTCFSGEMCRTNSDCSGVCVEMACRRQLPVAIRVEGLPTGQELVLDIERDGAMERRTITGISWGDPYVDIGWSGQYSISIAEQPRDGTVCTVDPSTPLSATTGPSGTGLWHNYGRTNLVDFNCSGGASLNLHVELDPELGTTFDLARTLDGAMTMVSVNQRGLVPLGSFTDSWSLAIVRQPTAGVDSMSRPFTTDCKFVQATDSAVSPTNSVSGMRDEPRASGGTYRVDRANPRLVCTTTFMQADAGMPDAGSMMDAGMDSGTPDAGSPDSGQDTGPADTGPPDSGPPDMGVDSGPPGACTLDSECPMSNCECGLSSGNCAGDSGRCGAAMIVIDTATTDGIAASGTFVVPAMCNEVFVQAWGAAGGNGGQDDGFGFFTPMGTGGAGGHVSGRLSVAEGDTFTVWIGQGGAFNNSAGAGTGGIGSNVGVAVSGGDATDDFDLMLLNAGASGGGLTSVQQVGSASRSFLVPGGGGGGFMANGEDTGGANAGDGATLAGGNGTPGQAHGGGGAGSNGGLSGQSLGEGGHAGAYATLPSGLTSMDGSNGTPAATSTPDHGQCSGGVGNMADSGSAGLDQEGGDGCVVIRCVGE